MKPWIVVVALAGAVVGALGGCVDDRTVALPEAPVQHGVEVFDIPVFVGPKLDVLFVIDSSRALEAHAEHLAAELPGFGEVLPHRSQDLHIGVVTADLGGPGCSARGDDGALRPSAELVGAPFLIDWVHLDRTRSANYPGELAAAVATLAAVGHAGCPGQQPLAALARALDDHPRNGGFRREDASLVVIVIAGQDDASPDTVDAYASFVRGLDPRPGSTFVAGIFERPAPRLEAFLDRFPNRAAVASIHDEDLAGRVLPRLGSLGSWGVRCLEASIDLDPARPGVQHDCSLSDVIVEAGQRVHDRVLPACATPGAGLPCWRLVEDPQICPFGDGLHVEVDRRDYPPRGTHLIGSCVTR